MDIGLRHDQTGRNAGRYKQSVIIKLIFLNMKYATEIMSPAPSNVMHRYVPWRRLAGERQEEVLTWAFDLSLMLAVGGA